MNDGTARRESPVAGADVRIERVRIAAEGQAHGDLQAQSERLAGEIGAAISAQVGRGRVRIGEVTVRVGVGQLSDAQARQRIVAAVARRVLDAIQD